MHALGIISLYVLLLSTERYQCHSKEYIFTMYVIVELEGNCTLLYMIKQVSSNVLINLFKAILCTVP